MAVVMTMKMTVGREELLAETGASPCVEYEYSERIDGEQEVRGGDDVPGEGPVGTCSRQQPWSRSAGSRSPCILK